MPDIESFIMDNAARLAAEAGITEAATVGAIRRQAIVNYRRNWGGAVDAIQEAIRVHRPMKRRRRDFGPKPLQTSI